MALTLNTNTISGTTIVTDSVTGGIVIDVSPLLSRIAIALETIATNSTTISNTLSTLETNVATLATNSTTISGTLTDVDSKISTIATNSTLMEDHQHRLRTLGDTTGVHIKSPYDDFTMVSIYRLLVEQGKAADLTEAVSQADQTAALAAISSYVERIQSLSNF